MFVYVVETRHQDQIQHLCVMPHMINSIKELLDSHEIPYRCEKTFVFQDPNNMQAFVIAPDGKGQLWLTSKLTLQLQGFCRLVKEVPLSEPARVTGARPSE